MINLPKPPRGQKWRNKKERDWLSFPKDHSDRVELSVAQRVIIREIWQQYYGKSNQAGGQAMPVEIVAERWTSIPKGCGRPSIISMFFPLPDSDHAHGQYSTIPRHER